MTPAGFSDIMGIFWYDYGMYITHTIVIPEYSHHIRKTRWGHQLHALLENPPTILRWAFPSQPGLIPGGYENLILNLVCFNTIYVYMIIYTYIYILYMYAISSSYWRFPNHQTSHSK